MRWLLRGFVLLLIALPLAVLAALWLALDDQARVAQPAPVSVGDIDRAIRLLRSNDPRGKLPGIQRAALLSQRDLELLINQAGQRYGEPRARVRLQPGLALLQASLPLPANPLGGWLNVDAVLREGANLPTVQRLHLGRLRVPGWLAELALPPLLGALNLRSQGELAQRMVSHVAFKPQQLVLAYAWPADAPQTLADGLLPAEEQARIKVYADRLTALGTELGTGPVSMARLLPPMFALARQRSTDAASAAREHRAALVVLAFVVSGAGLQSLVPNAPPPRSALRVTLAGRPDTAQHFLVSAALAIEGNGPLSDAIGLYKEVSDSRGGSGFSFNDLAADRAGTRFGLIAARQPQALQARLAAGLQEADLLPPIADLPEAMSAGEFQRRFGGVGGADYQRMMADIEARLDRLALLASAR
jgi:hypothetical protein